MKFKIGDKVETVFGKGEVLLIDNNDDDAMPYLVRIKEDDGHNGEDFLTEEEVQDCVIDKGDVQFWFEEDKLELIEEEKKMKFKIGDKVRTEYGNGEVLFIDNNHSMPYLVGIKEDVGHNGEDFLTEEEVQDCVIDKGYKDSCWWYDEDELELIEDDVELIEEETKMNKYVKMLMEDLGVEVGEEFEIKNYCSGLYHFDNDGNLIDRFKVRNDNLILGLMKGKLEIKKPEKLPILTKEQVGMLKGFEVLGYNYIARDSDGNLFTYRDKPVKLNQYWRGYECEPITPINDSDFTFIKWEDKEPFIIQNLLQQKRD